MAKSLWLTAVAALALAGPAVAQNTNDNSAQQNQGTMDQQNPAQPGAPGKGATGEAAPSKPGPTFASNQLTGKIQSVDPTAKQVTIAQPNGQQENLTLGENATVFMHGRLGSFQDLKEGQQVRAAYELKNGQKTLRWIEVTPSTEQQQPGATPPATPQPEEKGTPGGGADAPAAAPSTMRTEERGHEITGEVVSVDSAKHQLVLYRAGRHVILNVSRKAPIIVNGKRASLDDIKQGEKVRAALEVPSHTPKIALRVETVGKKGVAPMPEKKPTAPQEKAPQGE